MNHLAGRPASATAERVLEAHRRHHGREATVLARAPGRVNLIGEHTDYNDGFVLPAAIDFDTWVAAHPRDDDAVEALALDWHDQTDRFRPAAAPPPVGGWRDHVRGSLLQLHAAVPLPQGLALTIAGDVPQGAGLSSSASLGLALLRAAEAALALPGLDGPRLARLAQAAENRYVGCQCGVMDPMASACGEAGHALLIDCRSLVTRAVPMPPGLVLLIAHSRVRRGLVDSAYNERRRQCEAAAAALGVPALRDATLAQLAAAQGRMDPVVQRRARHILSDSARVLQAEAALHAGDLAALGELMAASHASMRDDFEITVPAVDRLAELLHAAAGGQGGARMTGGGFGGCVVALLPEDRVPEAEARVAAGYRSPDGEPALVFRCRASAGAAAFSLGA